MKTLEEIKECIKKELVTLDTKLFSEDCISLYLEMALKEYGISAKNEIIDELKLEELGWGKELTNLEPIKRQKVPFYIVKKNKNCNKE